MYIHEYREVRTNKRRGDCLNFPLGLEFSMTLKQPVTKQQEFQWAFQGPISWPFSFIKDHDLIHQNPKAKGQTEKHSLRSSKET